MNAADIISKRHEYKHMLDIIRWHRTCEQEIQTDHRVFRRIQFRLVSYVLQGMENSILHHSVAFLSEQGLSTDEVVLCFDGFMVPRNQINEIGQSWLEAFIFLGPAANDLEGGIRSQANGRHS